MMNNTPDYKRLFEEAQQERKKEQQKREEAESARQEADRARQEADRARHEEHLKREEADRARQEEHLKREEADRARQEEHLKREEADRARQEEQRKREESDRVAAFALPQNVTDFLEGCHRLYRQINPVVDLSSATTGNTTDPVNRLFPPCITPWIDFEQLQRDEWDRLEGQVSFWNNKAYPSVTALEYIARTIDPVGSEDDLRYLERLTMENMVKHIFDEVGKDERLRRALDIDGRITFENQASFRNEEREELSKSMGKLKVSGDKPSRARNTRADQFCVLRSSSDGSARPVLAIEYKAPHKLNIKEIPIGLQGEIRPERDVIDKDDDSFAFRCKNLLAAVVTQLFSYMIDKEVQYGYICTGEAFIFGHIPDDPTSFHYSVNIPGTDYSPGDVDRLERTAVGQVFAFTLQALRARRPGQEWKQKAKNLKQWKVEFLDVLQSIPVTERQSEAASIYKPSRWVPSARKKGPKTRSQCEVGRSRHEAEEDKSSSGDEQQDTPSKSKFIQTRSRAARASRSRQLGNYGGSSGSSSKKSTNLYIEERPYCTHQCLKGLYNGSAVDPWCPNASEHCGKHLPRALFLKLVRVQLAVDRGKDADCCPLNLHGARGALLKIRLSSHGYVFVAKGVQACNLRYLRHEARVYQHLRPLQGVHVPVCCGIVGLRMPYLYDNAELTHLLLLSWAGRSILSMQKVNAVSNRLRNTFTYQIEEAVAALGKLSVRHGDLEERNMTYDDRTGRLMVIDFERSSLIERKALSVLSPNKRRANGLEVICSKGGLLQSGACNDVI
jgi:tRNA A-37 threonylcarbamoyl transferase component Bud32